MENNLKQTIKDTIPVPLFTLCIAVYLLIHWESWSIYTLQVHPIRSAIIWCSSVWLVSLLMHKISTLHKYRPGSGIMISGNITLSPPTLNMKHMIDRVLRQEGVYKPKYFRVLVNDFDVSSSGMDVIFTYTIEYWV